MERCRSEVVGRALAVADGSVTELLVDLPREPAGDIARV